MTIDPVDPDFELSRDGDIWVAMHVPSGIASQGATPTEAVNMATEAAELHQLDHEPGDEEYQEEMLDRFGIDIDEV